MPDELRPLELSEEALHLIASRFKVLSDPLRLKLLIAIEQGEKNVSELVAATEATQTTVSRHLRSLALSGLVTRRKEGQNAFYAVSDRDVFALCKLVCGSLQKRLARQAKMARLFS